MDAYQRLRESSLAMIRTNTPQQYWEDLRARTRVVYVDSYAAVEADRNILAGQKIDYLLQSRHFKMEKLIVDLADHHGLSHTLNLIVQNNRRHAYVFDGDVAMTQSYVQTIGAMPQPAKFREQLANSMRLPRLDLGDEPDGAFVLPKLYGLIAHNPIGRHFREEDQKLGMIQFCLPTEDCKRWAIEFAIEEIVTSYNTETKRETPKRALRWKNQDGKKGSSFGKRI